MKTSTESKLGQTPERPPVDARRGITLVPRIELKKVSPVFRIAVRNDVFKCTGTQVADTKPTLSAPDPDSRRGLAATGAAIGLVAIAGVILGYFIGRNALEYRD